MSERKARSDRRLLGQPPKPPKTGTPIELRSIPMVQKPNGTYGPGTRAANRLQRLWKASSANTEKES